MNTESNKVLLLGIGETGLDVVRIVGENKIKRVVAFGITNESELKQLASNVIEEAELVLLVADLGRNKGNSLALQAATLAKGKGKVMAAFLVTKYLFKGEKSIMKALEAVREIKDEVDTSLIINKESVTVLPDEECSVDDLLNIFVPVEETIAGGIRDMTDLIAESGFININLEDLKIALAESGTFAIASGLAAGENRIGLAIESALSTPLMKPCDISTARKVLIKFLAPKATPVTMEEMNSVTEFIGKFPSHTDLKWGIEESDDNDILSVIILVSGFDVKLPE